MKKQIALVVAAYQVNNLGKLVIKATKRYFFYPEIVCCALECLWNMTDCMSVIKTGHFKYEAAFSAHLRGDVAKIKFFYLTIMEYKRLLLQVDQWKKDNGYSDSDIAEFMKSSEYAEALLKVENYIKDNRWK